MNIEPTTELTVLGWSVVLLVHIAIQGCLVLPKRGLAWNGGAR